MTGRRRRARSSERARRPAQKAPSEKSAATHLVDKKGEPHENVSVFEPTHGPNLSDRADTMDEHPETLPATDPSVERAGIPHDARIDEGQNRGGE